MWSVDSICLWHDMSSRSSRCVTWEIPGSGSCSAATLLALAVPIRLVPVLGRLLVLAFLVANRVCAAWPAMTFAFCITFMKNITQDFVDPSDTVERWIDIIWGERDWRPSSLLVPCQCSHWKHSCNDNAMLTSVAKPLGLGRLLCSASRL